MAQYHCITHGNCPDGAAAAALIQKVHKEAHIVYAIHERVNDFCLHAAKHVSAGGALYLADISCDEPTLVQLCEILQAKNAALYVYDHHVSQDWLQNFSWPVGLLGGIVFDNDRCGSRISFDELLKKNPELKEWEEFIGLINDRDLWLNEDERSPDFVLLHQILGDEAFSKRFSESPSVQFSESEQCLLNYEKKQMHKNIQRLLGRMEMGVDANGLRYGVMRGEGKASDVCNAAIEQHRLEYAFLLDFNGGRGSVRSRGKFDCATYCSVRGGGGHKRAAGFVLPKNDFSVQAPPLSPQS